MREDAAFPLYQEGKVSFWLKAKPGTRKLKPPKTVMLPDKGAVVELRVGEPAVDGKANEAIIARLAEEMGVAKREIKIKTGTTSALKRIEISFSSPDQKAKIEGWFARLEG